jgi:hypothetical protein
LCGQIRSDSYLAEASKRFSDQSVHYSLACFLFNLSGFGTGLFQGALRRIRETAPQRGGNGESTSMPKSEVGPNRKAE